MSLIKKIKISLTSRQIKIVTVNIIHRLKLLLHNAYFEQCFNFYLFFLFVYAFLGWCVRKKEFLYLWIFQWYRHRLKLGCKKRILFCWYLWSEEWWSAICSQYIHLSSVFWFTANCERNSSKQHVYYFIVCKLFIYLWYKACVGLKN